MEALEKLLQVRGIRRTEGRRQQRILRYRVNGLGFERWILKATIWLAFNPKVAIDGWRPPREWVEIVFGQRSFSKRSGLYLGSLDGARLALDRNRTELHLLTRGDGKLDGVELDLNGFKLILALFPLDTSDFEYRPRFLRDRRSLVTQQVVAFDWPPA